MNTDMATEQVTNMPSHQVSENGDKVTIHDLELFVGHIPGFDADDSGMEDLDDEAIEKIISRTKAHMSAGSNPKLVMLHQEEGKDCPPEALGDIVNIGRKDIYINTGDGENYSGPGIVGDVVMSKSDFEEYISSNRFPRRSAEIWKDGHMSEVALLGRETPARPLRDTRFAKTGEKSTYTRPVTFSEVAPGGSNTFVPGMAGSDKKEHEMAEENDGRLTIEHDGDDKDLIAKLRAENDTLREDLEQLKMQLNGDDEDDEMMMGMEEDEEMKSGKAHYEEMEAEETHYDEDEEEEDKEMFSRIRRTKNGKEVVARFKKLKSQRNAYRKVARGLGLKLRKAKFSKELDALQAAGYRVRGHRDHMMNELLATKDVEAKLKFWRATLKKNPIGKRLNMTDARVNGKTEYSAADRKSASDRAVARMTKENLNADQFQQVFEQELKSG
ncbi:MAG: hypothetical protein Tp1124DCM412911_5 [Prokaryotic dsDNA virus sp.]|nr:MAG: hypothetical protein Tp1124DCM412911_5 [Prokaryotic dsDNA virus sp.]|tara:strand:+ start:14316 stop:15641 length:1326 start_codon:yes stop_codon:yes gene_type:complete